MSIKNGIATGDMVFISAVDTKDPLYEYSKRPRGTYNSEANNKLTSLIGMTAQLINYLDVSKSGYCRAILRVSLPEDFFSVNGEDKTLSWWSRAYKVQDGEEMKPLKEFDILFDKGVKLEGISYMPSSLRYAYLKGENSIARAYVRPADDKSKYLESVLLP